MDKKRALGRGMDALLGSGAPSMLPPGGSQKDQTNVVDISRIERNPDQPRTRFDPSTLEELAQSIATAGLIQPIIVEKSGVGRYRIVAGERRFRAAQLAGLTEVPVLVREVDDAQRLEISLIENIQREDLNPMEEARAYRNVMDTLGVTQAELAVKVGKSRSAVANALRLLKLPDSYSRELENTNGSFTPGHARALLAVEEKEARRALFDRILAEELTVREAERLSSALLSGEDPQKGGEEIAEGTVSEKNNGKAAGSSAASSADPHIAALRERMIEKLGTKVSIQPVGDGGRIHIDFYSADDLERLMDLLDIAL